MTLSAGPDLAVPGDAPPARQRRPLGLLVLASAVAVILAAPLVFLVIETTGIGAHTVWEVIGRPLTLHLLWNTVRLTVVVTLLCAAIGTGAAFVVERTDLPWRRLWSVLVVVPLAVPDFVISWGWNSLFTWVSGFRGAVMIMTLSVYPLVYLPVASSLRNADPAQEEVARSVGIGPVATFFRVTLRQVAVAVLGGCLLVAMLLLTEYGAFEILGYQTFTTEIFLEYSSRFNVSGAAALSLVLVVLGVAVLAGESLLRGRGRISRSDRMAQRRPVRHRLGWRAAPTLLGLSALVALALGVPIGSAIHWWVEGQHMNLASDDVSLASATWHTAAYGVTAGVLAAAMALPVAVLAVRHRGHLRWLIERSTYLVLVTPGVIMGFSFVYFSIRYAHSFAYQTSPLLVVCYAIMFFPLALVGVKASVAQAPVGLEDVARSLGHGRFTVWWRITRPLVTPGLAAAFCLVFLSVVTELTATLILIPTGTQTLATQFWNDQTNLAYGQAAPFALLIVAVAAVPSTLLSRFFDRLPARAGLA